jgi:hypothetical protein
VTNFHLLRALSNKTFARRTIARNAVDLSFLRQRHNDVCVSEMRENPEFQVVRTKEGNMHKQHMKIKQMAETNQ